MSLLKVTDIFPVSNCFLGIGVDIHSPKVFKRPYHFLLAFASLLIWAIAMSSYAYIFRSDFERVVKGLAIIVQVYLMVFKIGIFFFKHKRFVRLVKTMEMLALEGDEKEQAAWNNETQHVKTIGWTYLSIAAFGGSIFALLPLATFLYHIIESGDMVIVIPFLAYFPFDYTQPFYGLMTNLCGWYFLFSAICTIIAVDNVFCWFVYNVSAHLRIIRVKLEKLAKMLDKEQESEPFHCAFISFIMYHRRVITFSTELDNVFSQIIFVEITLSCAQVCFLAYQVVYGNGMTNNVFYAMLLLAVAVQLMIYCFGGQKIQDEHTSIADFIYHVFPWHSMSSNMKRLFLLPLMRTQRPLILTGYFFIVDRSLLVWIFRTAGSFTALLFALKDKQ